MKKIKFIMIVMASSIIGFAQKPSPMLLTPTNHTLVLVDFESQMAFPLQNITIDQLRNNVAIISGASKIFNVPTVVTTIAEKTFSGPVFPELEDVYPKDSFRHIERTNMNVWEDTAATKAIIGTGKKFIVLAGLWTGICILDPALSAINEGYTVYVITDACGDLSKEAHEIAITRMVQAGVRPITSIQYLLELQRDWARSETYVPVTNLIKKYGGAYGIGVQYSQDMIKH